jgi:hypothetical protein
MDLIDTLGTFAIVVYIFLLGVAVLWFFLPFAIFGIRPRLDVAIRENERTNAYLEAIIGELNALRRDKKITDSQSDYLKALGKDLKDLGSDE